RDRGPARGEGEVNVEANASANYLTVASILSGFAVQVLVFRIGRELTFSAGARRLPWPDYLIVATVIVSLLLVVLPATLTPSSFSGWLSAMAAASCAAAAILMAAYPVAILYHYDVNVFGRATSGQSLARKLTVVGGVVALVVFVTILWMHNP